LSKGGEIRSSTHCAKGGCSQGSCEKRSLERTNSPTPPYRETRKRGGVFIREMRFTTGGGLRRFVPKIGVENVGGGKGGAMEKKGSLANQYDRTVGP